MTFHRSPKWFDEDARMHRQMYAAEAIRADAAKQFKAEVTDRYLYVAQVKPLEVAHRAGDSNKTRCGRQLGLFEQIAAGRAIENVMQACSRCGFEEHTE